MNLTFILVLVDLREGIVEIFILKRGDKEYEEESYYIGVPFRSWSSHFCIHIVVECSVPYWIKEQVKKGLKKEQQ